MSKPVEYSWIVRIHRCIDGVFNEEYSLRVGYTLPAIRRYVNYLRSLKGVVSVSVFKKFDNL
jgi:hypothetical protein